MPRNADSNTKKPRNPAVGITPLPSLVKWESPWEPAVCLKRIRESEKRFRALRWLVERSEGQVDSSNIDPFEIEAIVKSLCLEDATADRLAKDSYLISEWYKQSEFRDLLRLSKEARLDELSKAAKLAERFGNALELSAVEFEHILESLRSEQADNENRDLLALSQSVRAFSRDARHARSVLKGKGRKKDVRRNGAIALSAWAAEEATGEAVEISRGRKAREFVNAPGKFVLNFMRLLGWPDEGVLVDAFHRLRQNL